MRRIAKDDLCRSLRRVACGSVSVLRRRAFRGVRVNATVPLVLLTMRVIEAMRLRCWRVGRVS